MGMNLYLIRLDGTFARFSGVVADPTFVNKTGIGEPYRDIPQCSTSLRQGSILVTSNTGVTFTDPAFTETVGVPDGFTGTLGIVDPDDVSHTPPRQGDQEYTFWQFDLGVQADKPRYIYAEFRRGDIISNTAPNTDPSA